MTRTPGGSATTTSSSPTRCTTACGRSSPSPPTPGTGAWGPTSAHRRRSSCSRASARGAAHSGAAPSSTSSATRRRRAASTSSRHNFYSFPGSMSLHLAARSGDLDCIRKLLAWGADRLQRDSAGFVKRRIWFCEIRGPAMEKIPWGAPEGVVGRLLRIRRNQAKLGMPMDLRVLQETIGLNLLIVGPTGECAFQKLEEDNKDFCYFL